MIHEAKKLRDRDDCPRFSGGHWQGKHESADHQPLLSVKNPR